MTGKVPIRNGTKMILKSLDGSDLPVMAICDEDKNGGVMLGISPPVRKTPFVVVYVKVEDAELVMIDPARWDEAVEQMFQSAEAAVKSSEKKAEG